MIQCQDMSLALMARIGAELKGHIHLTCLSRTRSSEEVHAKLWAIYVRYALKIQLFDVSCKP